MLCFFFNREERERGPSREPAAPPPGHCCRKCSAGLSPTSLLPAASASSSRRGALQCQRCAPLLPHEHRAGLLQPGGDGRRECLLVGSWQGAVELIAAAPAHADLLLQSTAGLLWGGRALRGGPLWHRLPLRQSPSSAATPVRRQSRRQWHGTIAQPVGGSGQCLGG